MSAGDDVLHAARGLMLQAAAQLDEVLSTLSKAYRLLASHPDFRATEKAERECGGSFAGELKRLEAMTIAHWLGAGLRSIIEDIPLEDAARIIRSDLRNPRKDLEGFIADERRTLELRAKARGRTREARAA